jgi:hypothetical protein
MKRWAYRMTDGALIHSSCRDAYVTKAPRRNGKSPTIDIALDLEHHESTGLHGGACSHCGKRLGEFIQ